MKEGLEGISFYEYQGRYRGIRAWIFSTDHKRIGLLYLVTILTLFFGAVGIGFTMRLQMLAPASFLSSRIYNGLFTLHGVTMIFLVVIPGIPSIFGNFFLPIQIGARDMAFPRINLLSWWLFISGGILVYLSLFTGTGPLDTGWTFYVPYSIRTTVNVPLAVFGVFVIGLSSILTGVNLVTTTHRLRAPGMTWFRLPIFVWTLYSTAWVQILATPVLGITLVLIILDRVFGVGIFNPAEGGDPLLYQHLFWIYSHPAVYIIIHPAKGGVSDLIPVFARKRIFGYKAVAYSGMAIASVGSLVWGHHMFVSGQSAFADIVFSLFTFLVAIPSAIKVFNWVATLHKGSIVLEAPFLFCLGFIFLFSIGGLTGLIQGALAVNLHLHATYWIVGHFHYIIFGGMGFGFFAALHYWFPKMFNRMYNRKVAKWAWLILFVGFNIFYFSMLLLGWQGMPRRYYDYLPEFRPLQLTATFGSWIMVAGLILMFVNLFRGLFREEKVGENPWGAATLEWQIPSPPPKENFAKIPLVTKGPHQFQELDQDG
jgi:cytochrome c oxidase subunit 1